MRQAVRICVRAGLYVLALGALLFLTLWAAYQPFGSLKLPIALGIASAKAAIVLLIFMEQNHASALSRLAAVAGLCWLGLMIGLTYADIGTRHEIPPGYAARR